MSVAAKAQPTGGSVVAGSAQISASGASTLINQSTSKAIINWQSFSVGQGGSVQFNQPNSSAITLNRVTGTSTSVIDGAIRANGQVWLLNPNGLLFGNGATINVGGLLATTSDIADQDFLGGRYNFSSTGAKGSITNNGSITAGNGGSVVLSAPSVTNKGLIAASAGHVVLGGTDTFTVDFNGDHLLSYAISPNSTGGKVTNAGKIAAAGGTILMTARAAAGVQDAVINNTGMVEATSVRQENGEIILEADNGTVADSGTLDASGKAAGQTGGTVKVLGQQVAAADGAKIDVSGDAGGGTALIGGNLHGAGPEPNAQNTTVGKATINASAITKGDGGKVVVYSTGTTQVAGTITAQGGIISGKGGTVETSGHTLNFTGTTVDAGVGGQWLLDPYDLTVDTAAATTIDSTLNGGTAVTLQTSAGSASSTPSNIGNANPDGLGDIIINAPLIWNSTSSSAVLTLDAYRNVQFNANVTVQGKGGVSIIPATGGGGDYFFAPGYSLSFSTLTDAPTLQISGTTYTLESSLSQLASDISANSLGKFALANDYDASADGTYPASPIATALVGSFAGLGHTISNLTISSSDSSVGLFTSISGTVRDIGLVNANVSGVEFVGALVGSAGTGSTIQSSSATGVVSGFGSYTGGLVGENFGTVINDYSTATVTGNAGSYIGGLVGYNTGSISRSFASGAVSGGGGSGCCVGGLVGQNNVGGGSITDSYATGAVTIGGNQFAGGLVGNNNGGVINTSYATGVVSGASGNSGGLVGANSGTVNGSYWDTDTNTTDNSGAGSIGVSTSMLSGPLINLGFDGQWANAGNQTTPYLLENQAGSVFIGSDFSDEYALIFTMAQMQAINANTASLGGNYALANPLDASAIPAAGAGSWVPIGTDGSGNPFGGGFSGVFDGLNNTISNLSISNSFNSQGLFGFVHGGTIRDIGMVNATISGAGDVGALVGAAEGGAIIQNSYSTGTVTGTASVGGLVGETDGAGPTITGSHSAASVNGAIEVGGLVGDNDTGSITNSYATGAVTANGASQYAGGLVGVNGGSINTSFASGSVSDISSDGGVQVGGLAGQNTGSITDSYSMAAVSGTANTGGLVGINAGSVTTSYSTGAVSGGNHQGLIGSNGGSVTNSYWDTDTSGQMTDGSGSGSSGVPTSSLQTAGVPSGFNSSIWGSGLNMYPFLLSQGVPTIITGTVFADAGGSMTLPSNATNGVVTVASLVNGSAGPPASVGANGVYYTMLLPSNLQASNQVLLYVDSSTGVLGNLYFQDLAPGGINNVAQLYANTLQINSSASTLSAMYSGLGAAIGTNPSHAGELLFASGNPVSDINFSILAENAGGFSIDTLVNLGTGGLLVNSQGPVTQTKGVSAANLQVQTMGANADITLTDTGGTGDNGNDIRSGALFTALVSGNVSFTNEAVPEEDPTNILAGTSVAGNLTVNSPNSGLVIASNIGSVSATGLVTLSGLSISQTAPLTASGGLTASTASSINLTNAGNLISGTVTLTTPGMDGGAGASVSTLDDISLGNVSAFGGLSVISSGALTLTGNIGVGGSSGSAVTLDGSVINQTGGRLSVTGVDSFTAGASASASGSQTTLSLTSASNDIEVPITLHGDTIGFTNSSDTKLENVNRDGSSAATSVSILVSSGSGTPQLLLDSAINATGTVSLHAGGSILATNEGSSITAGTLILNSDTGMIGGNGPPPALNITASNLTAQTGGGDIVLDVGNINGNVLNIGSASNPGVGISAGTGSVTLNLFDTPVVQSADAPIIADTLNLNVHCSDPFCSSGVSVNLPADGNAVSNGVLINQFFDDATSFNFNFNNSLPIFFGEGSGVTNFSGNLTLSTTAGSGAPIVLLGPVSAGGIISLNADGDLGAAIITDTDGGGSLSAPEVDLKSNAGQIGNLTGGDLGMGFSGMAIPLQVTTQVLTAATNGGDINLTLLSGSEGGPLTIGGSLTNPGVGINAGTGNVTLTTVNSVLNQDPSSPIIARDLSITASFDSTLSSSENGMPNSSLDINLDTADETHPFINQVTGTLTFNAPFGSVDFGSLSDTTLGSSAIAADLTVRTAGAISIASNATVSGSTIELSAGTGISEGDMAAIQTGSSFFGTGSGDVSLNSTSNALSGTVNIQAPGNISLINSVPTIIGTIGNGTTSLSAGEGIVAFGNAAASVSIGVRGSFNSLIQDQSGTGITAHAISLSTDDGEIGDSEGDPLAISGGFASYSGNNGIGTPDVAPASLNFLTNGGNAYIQSYSPLSIDGTGINLNSSSPGFASGHLLLFANGGISVNAPVTTSGNVISIDSGGSVQVNAAITAVTNGSSPGAVVLTANDLNLNQDTSASLMYNSDSNGITGAGLVTASIINLTADSGQNGQSGSIGQATQPLEVTSDTGALSLAISTFNGNAYINSAVGVSIDNQQDALERFELGDMLPAGATGINTLGESGFYGDVSIAAAGPITQTIGIQTGNLTLTSTGPNANINLGDAGTFICSDCENDPGNTVFGLIHLNSAGNATYIGTAGEGGVTANLGGSTVAGNLDFADNGGNLNIQDPNFSPVNVTGTTTLSGAGISIQSPLISGSDIIMFAGGLGIIQQLTGTTDVHIASGGNLFAIADGSPISLTDLGHGCAGSGCTVDSGNQIAGTATFGAAPDEVPSDVFFANVPGIRLGPYDFGSPITGSTTSGVFDVATPGDITIEPGTTINAGSALAEGTTSIFLQAGGNFINNSGLGQGTLVAANDGFFNIYSQAPTGDTFGNLDSGNTAMWDASYLTPITVTGNRYLFAFQPTITVTAGNLSKQQGTDISASLVSDFTITAGLQNGVIGAYLGDTASAIFSGTPSVTSAGAAASAAGGSYPITISQGSLTVNDGYGLVLNNATLSVSGGTQTVTPPPPPVNPPPTTTTLTPSSSPALNGFTTSIQAPRLSPLNGDLAAGQFIISLPVVPPPPAPPSQPPVDSPLQADNAEQPTSSDQTTDEVANSLDGGSPGPGQRGGGGGTVIPRMLVNARPPAPPPTDTSALSSFGNSSLWQ